VRTARNRPSQAQTCRVTHPFHPLFNRELKIVTIRHNWKERRVYFHDDHDRLIGISFYWTSLYDPDPAVELAAGRSFFLVSDLLALVAQIRVLREGAAK